MPYIDKARRPNIDKDPVRYASEPGDMTYAFSRLFYKKWLATPRWTTYHKFRTWIISPSRDHDFEALFQGFNALTQFTSLDVHVAAETALDEFFWRVVRKYEDGKKIANGDVFKEVMEEVK